MTFGYIFFGVHLEGDFRQGNIELIDVFIDYIHTDTHTFFKRQIMPSLFPSYRLLGL